MLLYNIVKFQKPGGKGDFTVFREDKTRTHSKNWKGIDFSILELMLSKC